MISVITIDKEQNINSENIEIISNIDLNKDVLICCPFHKNFKCVEFNIDEFVIRSKDNIIKNASKTFSFEPQVSLSLPLSLTPDFKSNINGLHIGGVEIEKLFGIKLEQELKLNERILNIDGKKEQYVIYKNMKFDLFEVNYDLFKNNKKYIGYQIPKNESIISFKLLHNFIGENEYNINNIYIIHYDITYSQFPNFG